MEIKLSLFMLLQNWGLNSWVATNWIWLSSHRLEGTRGIKLSLNLLNPSLTVFEKVRDEFWNGQEMEISYPCRDFFGR